MDIGDTSTMRKLMISLVLIAASFNVYSQVTVKLKEYDLMDEKAKEVTVFYIAGIGNGLSWANVASVEGKQKPLYCPPTKLSLGFDNYKSFVDAELKKAKQNSNKWTYENMDLGQALLIHLQEVFPCNKGGTYGK